MRRGAEPEQLETLDTRRFRAFLLTVTALLGDGEEALRVSDVVRRTRRPRRVALTVTAASVFAASILLAAPALGIDERLRDVFDGTPVQERDPPGRDLHVASAMVHGASPRIPDTGAAASRFGAATEIRQLASRNGRNYFVIENRHGERCFAVGPVEKRDYVFGQVGCQRSPVFPSPELPIFDFSVLGGFGAIPHMRRLEGFAADGVATVALVLEDGGIVAETRVEHNVYSRTSELPDGAVREIVALDADGGRIYSLCLVRGGCEK